MSILEVGSTCSALAHAARVAMLVDAAAYFRVLREAILAAEQSVYIVGWDVDTRTLLEPTPTRDGLSAGLLEFLNQVLERRPRLRIHVLAWDFSVIYALERERMPSYKFASMAHPRLFFALDGRHQVGASHHQKLVVVDDTLAFCGGIDLTIRRWDTPRHAAADEGRRDPSGEPYAPMHDVQLAVSGRVAKVLGDMVRTRFRRATGDTLRAPRPIGHSIWPKGLRADFEDVQVGVMRTEPSDSELHRDVREIEQFTLRALRSARRTIYIENQYLTSSAVGEVLCERLREPGCPEVIVVLPKEECGWLEQSSMGVLRERMLSRLKEADQHARLQVLYPEVPGLGAQVVNLHSKVLIVDDSLFKVGSSNLSNRSLGLDTECDLVIEAKEGGEGERVRRAIAHARHRLLAEHLDLTSEAVAQGEHAHGSLAGLIAARANEERCLLPVALTSSAPLNLAQLEQFVVDPERPMAADAFINSLLPVQLQRPVPRSAASLSVLLAPLFVLTVAWHAGFRRSLPIVQQLEALVNLVVASDASWAFVIVGYVLLGIGLCPVTLLIALTVLSFGPVLGPLFALLGSVVSASVFYGLGRVLGHAPLGYLRGPRMSKLRADLRRNGFRATMAARLFPLGNFTAINLLAGALYVPFGAFSLGNLVGLLPGVLGTALVAQRLSQLLRQPSWWNFGWLLACLGAWSGTLWLVGWALSEKKPGRRGASRRWERRLA